VQQWYVINTKFTSFSHTSLVQTVTESAKLFTHLCSLH